MAEARWAPASGGEFMADVFISYSQREPEPTHTLAAEFVQHGIDAWFDVNLLPGDAFGKVIDGEIDRAKAVVTIWSRPALESTWVPAESKRALDQGKLLCVGSVSDIMKRDGASTGTLEDVFLELTKGDEVA